MRVVDTSAWIEGLVLGSANAALSGNLPSMAECIVPTIVQLELAKWSARNLSEEAADQVMAYTTKCVVVGLDTRLAIQAAQLGIHHRLPLADSVVYATALAAGADLLTCDAHFEGLEHVIYVPKA
jgi:predicted nucleic acid-binding protein